MRLGSIAAQRRRLFQMLKRRRKAYFPVAVCFALSFLVTILSQQIGPHFGVSSLFLFANGLLLSYLLLAPSWRWSYYLGASFAGMLLASLCIHIDWRFSVTVSILNLLHALLSIYLLNSRRRRTPRFYDARYLLKFVVFALIQAPLITGILYATATWMVWRCDPVKTMLFWSVSNCLGVAVATPACVALLRVRRASLAEWKPAFVYWLIISLAAVAAYSMRNSPVIFLLYPLLVLVVIFRNLAWGAALSINVAIIGGWMTQLGYGPIAQYARIEQVDTGLAHEIFMATGVAMLYIVSALMERRKIAEAKLLEVAHLHDLLFEYSRDLILLSDLYGNRNFVSAACERITGWTAEEMKNLHALEVVHPDDQAKVVQVMRDFQAGIDLNSVECRVRRKNGDYLWVEASLRLIRKAANGKPSGILNVVRDITERKETERKLHEAYKTLEVLAVTDPLTGLANRRRFDQALTTEWRRAMRNKAPLSMLLIDTDFFKTYNDEYGHLNGDACLKMISKAIASSLGRTGDLACRFGGEEFAVILPLTDNTGAQHVAERICEAVRHRKLRHSHNPTAVVTISVGCATLTPTPASTVLLLLEAADRALYKAKNEGRNRVCNANDIPEEIAPKEKP